jgi:large subunit ribosomal protein L25
MSRPKLSAAARQVHGKAVKNLRRQGIVPAVVFGHDVASNSIQIDAHEFELLRRRTGRNTLLDLSLDGKQAVPVLVHQVQQHPITRKPLHVDLLVVRMTEELTVEVPVVLTGESSAVEKMGGVLLQLRNSVQVRALPDHLPQSVELDITPLEDFDQVLHVSDIVLPGDVTLLTDDGEAVARVQAPRVEEVEPVAEVAEEGEEPTGEAAEEGAPEEESSAE